MNNTKHQLRYSVQYDFIPELVEVVSKDILPCAIFYMFDIWKKILKDKYGSFFELEQGYDCKVIEINDRYDLYFYAFPEPEVVPLASSTGSLPRQATKSLRESALSRYLSIRQYFIHSVCVCIQSFR